MDDEIVEFDVGCWMLYVATRRKEETGDLIRSNKDEKSP